MVMKPQFIMVYDNSFFIAKSLTKFYSFFLTENRDPMRKSLEASLTAVFAALHAVLYFISLGLW
jgi:hypothetical protein